MKKMTVWDMMKDRALGTVTLDDQGVIVAHDTQDELLDEAVTYRQTPQMFVGRVKTVGFRVIKDEGDDSPDVDNSVDFLDQVMAAAGAIDWDQALAAARTTVHPSRSGDIVRKAIEE